MLVVWVPLREYHKSGPFVRDVHFPCGEGATPIGVRRSDFTRPEEGTTVPNRPLNGTHVVPVKLIGWPRPGSKSLYDLFTSKPSFYQPP